MEKIMLPLIVRKSRWRSAGSLVGSLIVLGISTSILMDGGPTWFAWVLILIFGGIAVICLERLWDPKPRLTISEEGICVAYWNVGTISWNDLSEVFVKTDGVADYICLTLRYPENFRGRMSKVARAFNTATRQTGFSDFTVKPADMGLDTKVVFELVREQIENNSEPHEPTKAR